MAQEIHDSGIRPNRFQTRQYTGLFQLDEMHALVRLQSSNRRRIPPQQLFDRCRSGVAAAEPNNLRWRTEKKTPLHKIGVLSHDNKVVKLSVIPDGFVRRAVEAD